MPGSNDCAGSSVAKLVGGIVDAQLHPVDRRQREVHIRAAPRVERQILIAEVFALVGVGRKLSAQFVVTSRKPWMSEVFPGPAAFFGFTEHLGHIEYLDRQPVRAADLVAADHPAVLDSRAMKAVIVTCRRKQVLLWRASHFGLGQDDIGNRQPNPGKDSEPVGLPSRRPGRSSSRFSRHRQ
jgi:hypothetical protein